MNKNRMIVLPAAALFAMAAAGIARVNAAPIVPSAKPAPIEWNMAGPAPHFVAHYIPWFTAGPEWSAWKRSIKSQNHDPERRLADGRRDIGSIFYPLIGPYSTLDPSVVRYQLATMKAAGIQGVFIDWHGDEHDKAQGLMMVHEAGKLGMRVALCYEEKTNFTWASFRSPKTRDEAVQYAVDDLTFVETKYASLPGYMRCNGRPLLFVWPGEATSAIGPGRYTPEEWRRILGKLPEKPIFGSQGADPSYSSVCDFRYGWFSPVPGSANDFSARASRMVASGQAKFFVGSLCPGFDDTPVWGWGRGPRVVDRKGLSCLRDTFDRSLKGNPEIVQIVTWNDFNEGTVVEPTRSRGFDDMDALATWIAARSRKKADLNAIRKPFREYVRNATPAQRAELPPGTLGDWTASRRLTIEVPNYLDTLVRHRLPESPLYPANDLKSWSTGFSFGDKTNIAIDGDAVRIDIGKVDETFWHTHILQAGIPLKEGQSYLLKLRAKADTERPILAMLQNVGGDSGDWHTLGLEQSIPLTTSWQEFSYPFKATRVTDDGAQFVIQMGQQTGSVWIANLSLSMAK
ncbi:MAG: carbohydrate binding domain-containing protein [Capsulimonadaceae bacterium]|nr:carbohydrate binding domain-containing protein [Capsulimonadaceae bacterium]